VEAQQPGDRSPFERERPASIEREVPLSRGRYLLERQQQDRGRIVSFNLQLSAVIGGQREVVARIDTDHGTVHMHRYAHGGVEEIEVIEQIPADSPSDFLENAYLAAYDYLVSGADQLIDAWDARRPLSAEGI
jgi:hypothetical protein